MAAADLIRYARAKTGLSQRELGRMAGVTQAAIARIEKGRSSPAFETLERLLEACGFEVEIVPTRGRGVDRGGIRELLRLTPAERARLAAEEGRNLERVPARR